MKPINQETVKHLIEVIDAGLSHGMGNPKPGEMCIEAAICYALGLDHGDDPQCVMVPVRRFKINLNDSSWSGRMERAKGLREAGVAQLGSNTCDQFWFCSALMFNCICSSAYIIAEAITKVGLGKELPDAEQYIHDLKVIECIDDVSEICEKFIAHIRAYEAPEFNGDEDSQEAHNRNRSGWVRSYTTNVLASLRYQAQRIECAANAYKERGGYPGYQFDTIAAGMVAIYDKLTNFSVILGHPNKDNILSIGASDCVEALRTIGSPGCSYLYLCHETQPPTQTQTDTDNEERIEANRQEGQVDSENAQ